MKKAYIPLILVCFLFSSSSKGCCKGLLSKIFCSSCCKKTPTDSYFWWGDEEIENKFVVIEKHKKIYDAIQRGQLEKTKNIFEDDFKIEKFKGDFYTGEFEPQPGAPFAHMAAYYNRKKILEYFLTKGFSKNTTGLVKDMVAPGTGPWSDPESGCFIRNKHTREMFLYDFAKKFKCEEEILELLDVETT